jgi:hypothetical protein
MRSSWILALVVSLWPMGLSAAEPTKLSAFAVAADGETLKCTVEMRSPTDAQQGLLTVTLPNPSTDPEFVLTLDGERQFKIPFTIKAHTASLLVDKKEVRCAAHAALKIQYKVGGEQRSVDCPVVPLFLRCRDEAAIADTTARLFWNQSGVEAITALKANAERLPVVQRPPERTAYLVHLPSGQPAAPFPGSITEGTAVQVAIIADAERPRQYQLTPPACAELSPFRTTLGGPGTTAAVEAAGNAERVRSAVAKLVGPEIEKLVSGSKNLSLFPVGQFFACGAGDFRYELETDQLSGDPKSVYRASVRVRPRYHLAAIAVGGYDTASRSSFTTVEMPGAGAMGLRVIAEERSRIGTALYLGAVWMIGGRDFETMSELRGGNVPRWIFNLFVAANPRNPLRDVAAGLALTPSGGVSLAVGVTLHERTVLRSGFTVGGTIAGEGDVPTRSTWDEIAPGLLVGLAIDSRVYDALVARFQAK